jgi:AcrR family transcriptional regulator
MSTYHHGDLPPALLKAAGKILEKEGIAGLSLRELARRAGVSHSAPYRHFPDRDALLAALATEGFALLRERLESKAGPESAAAYVRFALDNPQRFRLMFGGQIAYDRYPGLREQANAAYAGLEKQFSQYGSEAGIAAAAAWSLVHGLSHLLLDGHFPEDRKAGADAFVRRVIGAVRFSVGGQRSA